MFFFDKSTKIYVAGHKGMVGSSICRELKKNGYTNLIYRSHVELDLQDQKATNEFILDEKPDVVFLAAAKVGGIYANDTYPADFLISNLDIQSNVIKASFKAEVKRLFFLGSSCIYPSKCSQPIKEEFLLTSSLEPTNRPYAIAKIAGIEMCWSFNRQKNTNYLGVMPCNLYGLNDNYDINNSHVLPALIRKIHEAKINKDNNLYIWGTGEPLREFLYSDDLAKALILLMNLDNNKFGKLTDKKNCPIINIGSDEEISIKDLALKISHIMNYDGNILFDTTKPDGTFRKLLNNNKIRALGWKPEFYLDDGIRIAYKDFLKHMQ